MVIGMPFHFFSTPFHPVPSRYKQENLAVPHQNVTSIFTIKVRGAATDIGREEYSLFNKLLTIN